MSSLVTDSSSGLSPGEPPGAAVPPSPPGGPGRDTVLRRTDDRCGRWGVLRQGYWNGERGSNYAKLAIYHNVTDPDVWSFTIRAPGCGGPAGGQAREYYSWSNKVVCRNGLCAVVDDRRLRLVQEYRRLGDGRPFGAVTLYCLQGYDRPRRVALAVPAGRTPEQTRRPLPLRRPAATRRGRPGTWSRTGEWTVVGSTRRSASTGCCPTASHPLRVSLDPRDGAVPVIGLRAGSDPRTASDTP